MGLGRAVREASSLDLMVACNVHAYGALYMAGISAGIITEVMPSMPHHFPGWPETLVSAPGDMPRGWSPHRGPNLKPCSVCATYTRVIARLTRSSNTPRCQCEIQAARTL